MILLLASLVSMPLPAFAVPALDRAVTVTEGGVSVTLTQRGDEFSHWLEDSRGNAVIRTSSGRYEFAKLDENGRLKASGIANSAKAAAPAGAVKNFTPPKNAVQTLKEKRAANQSLLSRTLSAIKEAVTGWHSRAVSGDKNLMVVRVNFVGTPLVSSEDFHRDKIWKEGGEALSVRQYYKDQSHNKLNVISADYTGGTGF